MSVYGQVPLTGVLGNWGVGKSFSVKLMLSLFGLKDNGMFKFLSEAQRKQIPSTFGLPMCLNDERNLKAIEDIAMPSFEAGIMSKHGTPSLNFITSPIITLNNDVMEKLLATHG